MSITISQALRRIKSLKGSIATHTQRAKTGVSYVENKHPAFRFNSEVAALLSDKKELVDLEAKVARANAISSLKMEDKSISLVQAIRELQEIKAHISFLEGLSLRSEVDEQRYNDYTADGKYVSKVKEIVWVSDLSEVERDTQVKSLQGQFEKLNNLVETANHTTVID